MTAAKILVLLSLWFFVAGAASAHELRPAYVEIMENEDLQYAVRLRQPVIAGRALDISLRLPETCETSSPRIRNSDLDAVERTINVSCTETLRGESLAIGGLDLTNTDAIIAFVSRDKSTSTLRATPAAPDFLIPAKQRQGFEQALLSYFTLGLEHIFFGLDHLFFISTLVLLLRNSLSILRAATAFTTAHSITLVATTLGWVHPLPTLVEALIALSILVIALQLALPTLTRSGLAGTGAWPLTFGFGLLHGFGFAGALEEIGLPENQLLTSLAAFNIGIEIGQIVIVAVLLAVLRGAQEFVSYERITNLSALAIGSVSFYWIVDRII